jgi:hypothetical protein
MNGVRGRSGCVVLVESLLDYLSVSLFLPHIMQRFISSFSVTNAPTVT